jgi:hypothetical protein
VRLKKKFHLFPLYVFNVFAESVVLTNPQNRMGFATAEPTAIPSYLLHHLSFAMELNVVIEQCTQEIERGQVGLNVQKLA